MHQFLMYGKDPREFDEKEDNAANKGSTNRDGQDDEEDIIEELGTRSSNEGESDEKAIAKALFSEDSMIAFEERKDADCKVWRYNRAMRQPRVHLDINHEERRRGSVHIGTKLSADGQTKLSKEGQLKDWTEDGERDKDEELLKKWLFDTENPPMTRHQQWKYVRKHYQLGDGSEPFRDILIKCLRYHPKDRPTLENLRDLVKVAAGEDETPSEKDVNILLKRKRARADEEAIDHVYNPAAILAAEKAREVARARLATSGVDAPAQ